MTFKSFLPMAALCLLASCSNSSKQEKAEGSSADSVQTSVMSFQDCDLTLGGIHFTKMLNEADKQVSEKDGVITFVAPEKTDLFIDPNDAKLTANTAKVLFTEVDNTKPFTFSAKMKPGFTPDGLYHAADLIVMANDTLYQNPHFPGSGIGEFCFPVLISSQRIDAGAEQQTAVLVGGKRNHPVLHPAVFSAGISYPQVVAEYIIAIVLGSRVTGDVAQEGYLLCMAPAEIVGVATVEDEVLVKRRQLADPFLWRNAQHISHSAEIAVAAVSAVISH